MPTSPISFSKRAAIGSLDPNLIKSMQTAKVGIFKNADTQMAHPDFQKWRNEGARIRDDVLANLANYLEKFEKNATAAGAIVHWAKDDMTACQIACDIAKETNCKTIIKSKSMLTEEIKLNASLEKNELDVLETDLGEYVVQLLDSRPSHIIAPIIHMTAEQVRDIFAKKHNTTPGFERHEIVAEAREQLRPKLLSADLGITGANFLIANTGSAVLVTNEGNGRFCGQVPKVRITMAGIEKVIPSFSELAMLLRLLPRAATGQHSSAYVSIGTGISGISNPKQHHIILVDNGRSKMLNSKYRAMLRCIRCGSCMNHCPVYTISGGHSYDSVYVGPMGAVLSPNLFGSKHDELPHAATMCNACSVHCPVKIPLPDLMRSLREDQVERGAESFKQKLFFFAWHFVASRPYFYGLSVLVASKMMRLMAGSSNVLHKLPGAQGWFSCRDLTVPSNKPFRFNKYD